MWVMCRGGGNWHDPTILPAPTLTCTAHVTLESDIECVATSTFMRIEDKMDEELHILKKQRITESPTLRLSLTSSL